LADIAGLQLNAAGRGKSWPCIGSRIAPS
jgi:hypothetical protein